MIGAPLAPTSEQVTVLPSTLTSIWPPERTEASTPDTPGEPAAPFAAEEPLDPAGAVLLAARSASAAVGVAPSEMPACWSSVVICCSSWLIAASSAAGLAPDAWSWLARLAICCWICAASWLWFALVARFDKPFVPLSRSASRFEVGPNELPRSWQVGEVLAASWDRSVLGDLRAHATVRPFTFTSIDPPEGSPTVALDEPVEVALPEPDVEPTGTFTTPRLPFAPTTTGTADVGSAVDDGSVEEAGWACVLPAPKPSA